MIEHKQSSGFVKYLNFAAAPSLMVAMGTFTGVGGLAEIVKDIMVGNQIDTTDKLATAMGAAFIMQGYGLLKEAYKYR